MGYQLKEVIVMMNFVGFIMIVALLFSNWITGTLTVILAVSIFACKGIHFLYSSLDNEPISFKKFDNWIEGKNETNT